MTENSGTLKITFKKWGNDFFRFERLDLGRNRYFGFKVLNFKVLFWCPLFD